MILSTARSVSAWREISRTALLTSSTWVAVNRSLTKPTAPARAKMSGGTDSTAKNAASAASPVTRCRRHDPTVVTMMRQRCSRQRRSSTSARRGAGVSSRASTMSATLSTGCTDGPDLRGGSTGDVVLVTPVRAGSTVGPMSDRPSVDARTATNQAPALVGHNVVTSDLALTEALARHGSASLVEELTPLGAEAGTEEAREHGMLANRHHPELVPYDRWGNRVDEVRFHPSWHWLMERAVGHGLQAAPWEQQEAGDPHAHLRRAAGAAGRRGRRQGVGAPAGCPVLRPRRAQPLHQDRGAGRDGHDGEAGRLRRPLQPDPRDPYDGRRVVPPRRPQVVHLGPDERRLPRARAGRRRDDVLRRPAGARGRHPQPDRRGAAQGQARQPVQRVERARAHRHARPAPR